jgi:hypothetical protein
MATGTDLEGAFQQISRLKQEHLEKARASDLLDTLPPPSGRSTIAAGRAATQAGAAPGPVSMKADILSFSIKLGIVYVSVMILIGVAVLAIRPAVHGATGKHFWAKAADDLHRSATSEGMPPENQARVLADIRTLVARYRPFIDELRPLFSDQTPKPGPDPK